MDVGTEAQGELTPRLLTIMDNVTPEERSRIMAQVRGTGTGLEVRVQRALDALGVAYSLEGKGIAGNPDIVLPKLKLAVFANGCFWHWHGCKRSRMPVTNREYWEAKIARNVRRDRKNKRLLWAQGWHCWTIWECDVERGVARMLGKIAALKKEKKRNGRS